MKVLKTSNIGVEANQRRQEIIEIAFKLFSEQGYENTSIVNIADEMNVSPSLCYRYFKSKIEILAATSAFYALQAVEEINRPISESISAVEKLNRVIQRLFEFSVNHQEFES